MLPHPVGMGHDQGALRPLHSHGLCGLVRAAGCNQPLWGPVVGLGTPRPRYSFAERKAILVAIRQLTQLVNPRATIIGGDFNCEAHGDTSPLYYAPRSPDLFQPFHLAHPLTGQWSMAYSDAPALITFWPLPTSPPCNAALLLAPSTHMGLVATIDVHDSTN